MDRHLGDLPAAVEAAVLFVLTEAARRTLLRTVLGAGRYPDDRLVPLAVREGVPLLTEVIAGFRAYAAATWPSVPPAVSALLVETLMRVTVSHAVAPLRTPAEAARELGELARLAVRGAP
ncbi:hypothetical protein [Spirillospora sp. NPDC029432]|uniref:hypothetical protein n=1 Tax=Spirillospora sp. NPDC029432 TaxID=3154599 RepID=UPI003451C613